MSKEQKRLAAIALCIMGIMGTLMAMKSRPAAANPAKSTVMQTESAAM